jgi:predicted transcriptional regulator
MLQKKLIVYRHLLEAYLEKHEDSFTQSGISKKFSISLSTVNNALSPLRSMGIISVKARSFDLTDPKKLMIYFATMRNPDKDIIYATRFEAPVSQIEKLMPSSVVFSAYSAFRFLYGNVPADYSEVYAYLPKNELPEVKRRFPPASGPSNVFFLEADPFIRKGAVSPPQLFADLWNLRSWYAKEFLNALEKRLFA